MQEQEDRDDEQDTFHYPKEKSGRSEPHQTPDAGSRKRRNPPKATGKKRKEAQKNTWPSKI